MIQGVVQTTGEKSGADTSSYANWTSDIFDVVGTNLVNSNVDSDYLEFTQRNRNLKILKRSVIKPKRNQSIRKAIVTTQGGSGENYTAPPPVEFSVKHSIPLFKQRLPNTNETTHPIMNNCYIPFVAFMCEELTSNTGTITIEQSSRFWYTDM